MSMSLFQQAFAKARKEQGAGGTFDFQGKSYSTNTAEEGLRKQASVKKLEKGGLEQGLEKLGGKGGMDAGADIAADVGKEMFGGEGSEGGEAVGGAISGAATGAKFGGATGAVVGAIAGGVMGLMGAKEAKKRRMGMAEAQGMMYKADAEATKGDIKGKMSEAFSNTLLSGMNRKVSL